MIKRYHHRLRFEMEKAALAGAALKPPAVKQTKLMLATRRWFEGYSDGLKRALLLFREEAKRK